MNPHPAYRETQTYTMLWVVLVATGLTGAFVLSLQQDRDALAGLLILAASLLGALLCLGRLVIEVHADELRWSFGYIGWPHWSVPMAHIARLEVTHASLLLGSGIRGSSSHRQYNITMGGPALRLHLHDGRTVTLGTPDPRRLATFIEARLPAQGR